MLESENDVPTVTIGKYNMAKDIVVVAADKPLRNVRRPARRAARSASSPSAVRRSCGRRWRKDLDGRTLAESPDDLQMAITDFDLAPELVVKGDLCAGVTSIYNAIPFLMSGQVKGLYDNKSASQLYAEKYEPGHEGMNSNNFVVARRAGTTITQRRSRSSWRSGSAAWTSGRPTRTRSSRPTQTTSATRTTRSSTYLKNWYETQFDEFVDSVYLDEDWINGEAQVTELLREAGLISEDQQQPVHVCIDPETGEETCRIPS